MYRDGYGETGWTRFLRRISASFRLGVFFRVEVRVFWLTLVVLPLILLLEFGGWGLGFLEVATLVVLVTVPLYLIVWTHEMGHILAARRYHIHTPLITLSPLGGLAHLSTPVPKPSADVVVSLAGPAVHLLWLAVFWPLSFAVEPTTLLPSGWVFSPLWFTVDLLVRMNVWMLGFNLLPFFPLDGGRVLRALLSKRMHPNKATRIAARIGQVGAVGIGIVGLVYGAFYGVILVAIGLTNFLACRRELVMARYGVGPYMAAERREPWQSDPDAWKSAGTVDAGERRPGFFARRRLRRQERAAHKERGEAERLAREVDRVLARVSEVGMSGLTASERKILERASKARRGD